MPDILDEPAPVSLDKPGPDFPRLSLESQSPNRTRYLAVQVNEAIARLGVDARDAETRPVPARSCAVATLRKEQTDLGAIWIWRCRSLPHAGAWRRFPCSSVPTLAVATFSRGEINARFVRDVFCRACQTCAAVLVQRITRFWSSYQAFSRAAWALLESESGTRAGVGPLGRAL